MFDFSVVNDNGSDMSNVNPTLIKVIGCGGGGCNAVDNMIRANIQGVEFIALNTDLQTLNRSMASKKIAIGQQKTGGRGAGGNPEIGEKAAEEDKEAIKNILQGANMVFITAGMGGGTGTGSAPVVARLSKELGALTVGVVTTPFNFEGAPRMKTAIEGIKRLRNEVDSLIVVPNQKLFDAEKKLTFKQSFAEADDVLRQGVQGISDIVTKPGVVNTDFADVQSAMQDQGEALLGIGIGAGENRAVDAATRAINNRLLEDSRIDDAKNLLVNITGTESVLMNEIEDIMGIIRASADPNAHVFWGQVVDENMEDKISVTVIATGFKKGTVSESETDEERAARMKAEEEARAQAAKRSDMVDSNEFDRLLNGRAAFGGGTFQKSPVSGQSGSSNEAKDDVKVYGGFVTPKPAANQTTDMPLFDKSEEKQGTPKPTTTMVFGGSKPMQTMNRNLSEIERPTCLRRQEEFGRKIVFGK